MVPKDIREEAERFAKVGTINVVVASGRSNPKVLFKALTLLVNLLCIFIYAYAPLP